MRLPWISLVLAVFWLCAEPAWAAERAALVEEITLLTDPPAIRIRLDRSAEFRAVKVDRREVMVALRGVRLSEKARRQGQGGKQLRFEHLPGNVVALVVTADADLKEIRASWNESANTLTVLMIGSEATSPEQTAKAGPTEKAVQPEKSAKTENGTDIGKPGRLETVSGSKKNRAESKKNDAGSRKQSQPEGAGVLPAAVASPAGLLPGGGAAVGVPPFPGKMPTSAPGGMKGGSDDLLPVINEAPCPDRPEFIEALQLCNEKNWLKAFRLLNTLSQSQLRTENQCQEKMFYLRAVAYLKLNSDGDEQLLLEAINYFQDAISYFPSSPFAPYAMASIGKIYKTLKNYAEAKGYFKIVLDKNKDYEGRPEIMYELGRIYAAEKNLKSCIAILKDFLTEFPGSRYALDAKLELGRALYDSNRYNEALEMFTSILVTDPQKAFESPDLLLNAGNSYYQLGKFPEAREMLIKAFNYFPNVEDNPITLTRVADTYRDTGRPDRANKLYQIVMDRYPATDGYAISAMRRAALVESREEKEKIYRMVISKFPVHPMTRLAQVKLADLQYKAGEFRRSIETIRPLVSAGPKDLLAEGYYLMHSSFLGLFSELLKTEAYPEIIALYQKEGGILRRFPQPEIYRIAGLAYLKGHIYDEAAKLLATAEKAYGIAVPPELYFDSGVALDESGDTAQALAKFQLYLQRAPKGDHVATSYYRMGGMALRQGNFQGALDNLKKALALSKNPSEKISVLRLMADASEKQGESKMVVDALSEAGRLMEESGEKDVAAIFGVFQQLAETHMQLKQYSEAVGAFGKAIEYSGNSQPPALLVRLGEAYFKAGQDDRAVKVYTRVKAMEDEFWSNLATERLQRIQVENRIQSDIGKK